MSKQILLCDTDSRAVSLVERVFPNYHCDIVSTASAAIAKLDCDPPDLFVMGTELSDMNYVELLGKIRQSPKLQDLAIILLTDDDKTALYEKLLPYKITSILNKEPESKPESQSEAAAPVAHTKPVLVIAKSSSERKILSTFLTEHGFRAYAYSDVGVALKAMDELGPRVLVFDLEDSFSLIDQIFSRLAKDPKLRPGLVIAVSGTDNAELQSSLLSKGVDLFLKKPLTPSVLNSALGKSKAKNALANDPAQPAPEEGISQDDMEAARRRNVLIVTPSVVCARSISVALSTTKFHISTATSGSIALNILSGHEVDLIILDLSVSENYSSQFIAEYRKAGNTTPALALTQAVSSQETSFLQRQGISRVLEKPYTNNILIEHVMRLIYPNQVVEAPADANPAESEIWL